MDKGRERELERLAGYYETLDQGLADTRVEVHALKVSIDGDPSARPFPITGLRDDIREIKQRDHQRAKRIKWLVLGLCGIGAFIGDVSKDVITEFIKRNVWREKVDAVQDARGKQLIRTKHYLITPNPRPMHKTVKETKDKIIEDIYIEQRAEDTGPGFLK
jgi:hypothetical protein